MVSVSNSDQIRQELEKFKKPDNVANWILLGYKDANTLELKKTGSGVPSLVASLADNECSYILIRVVYNENDEGFKDGIIGNKGNIKDVFIAWTGPSVGIIEKGKKRSHVGDAKAILQPHHAELSAISKNNFNEKTIKERSAPLSGSHVLD
ncbi:hypothetical protein DFA_01115 [Cavenderia fasciculata]|uniref:ADF-H domain-containing protein n=1 Tax=Cavenderia fasciculata TaxID=261658 RepID=F4PQX5_CACFS|nr:uncharacterized protein DFA_01115 [Cavenderia fasciculata]EGG21240.1 hypothetical protein DFA_01115 [Cavenderia fasciculata]|eukprot:XP_004359090.1 hypothetical protein DFA_01115 [Cavenderia fasciculata]